MARKGAQDKLQGLLAEVLRKVPLSGADLNLPKELLQNVQGNLGKSRKTILDIVSREVTRVAAKVDAQKVLEEILRNNRIKIQAEIILEPKKKGKS